MITRTLRVTGRLAALIGVGVVAGLVVAGLAYPFVALSGLGVKKGTDILAAPADGLRTNMPYQTTHVYASDGQPLAEFYDEYRTYTPLATMSVTIQNAIVAAEDSRFYQHHGVDLKGVARALVANHEAGEVAQGASTLTMQYVRNVLRDTAQTPAEVRAATEQTGARKLREMKLAIELEKHASKKEILERYLNQAYFGHRAYGIQAAAEIYFSKAPRQLTLAEAAMLAGVVQAPSAYDPAGVDARAATARRDYVITRMVELGYASPADGTAALAAPIALHLTQPPNDCVAVRAGWGYFCQMFKSWWSEQPAFGDSPAERLATLRRGGYQVVTTLNPRVQDSATAHILAAQNTRSPYALGLVALEPGTGRVQAMAVNRTYSLDRSHNGTHSDPRLRKKLRGNYPNTVNPLLGGGDLSGYQAGSTFKLFTMLAALEAGMPLNTAINSPQQLVSIYRTTKQDPTHCALDRWCPQNASAADTGRQTMWSGFGKSVNTYFVQLEQRVGADAAVRMAERLGLHWRTGIDRLQASAPKARSWGAFTLGVADTTPLEMAGAYATVVADGMHCDPLPVIHIAGPDGHEVTGAKGIPVATPRCTRAVSPEVARGALDAARCVTGYKAVTGDCGSWSTASSVYPTVRRPVAGKTGTTDDNRSAWFIGMTPAVTAAAFVADPDNPFHRVSGAQHAMPRDIVAKTLRDALAGTPVRGFIPPSASTAYGPGGKTKTTTHPRRKPLH